MLALSPTMKNGKIVKWHKKEGDTISSGQVLCDVETDKATMEYESGVDGTLLKILATEGSQASIGDTIAVSGQQGENIESLLATLKPTMAQGKPKEPDAQAQPAPKEETRRQTPPQKQEKLPAESSPKALAPASPNLGAEAGLRSSPLARKLAQANQISLSEIQGTGPGGRIIKRDIEAAQKAGTKMAPGAPGASVPTAQTSTEPLSQKRKIIAERLVSSKFSAPHYYLKLRVRMNAILDARKRINEGTSEKISLNAFLVKFCAETLKKHPTVHSTWKGDRIERFSSIDIGLAVAQKDGLITPVVRNCGQKGIREIDRELKVLIEKALANRLTPEEFQNATFTISNLGSYGIEEFTAIINPPGSAILALGEIRREPIVEEDKILISSVMKMTLSCDHRVIDGAIGAAFLKELKDSLESPILTLL